MLSSNMEAVADALGLEFYIGAPRGEEVSESPPSEIAGTLERPGAMDILSAVREELARRDAATEAALKELISRLPPLAQDLTDEEALADPAVSAKVIDFPGARQVAVRELQAAAGGGALELDEMVTGHVFFRAEWLKQHRLDPDRCTVIGVMGESMDPTLPGGCSILVDLDRRRRRSGNIFVVRTDDGLIVKRAGKDNRGRWQLLSDNDSPNWPPLPWAADAEVIGEVKWMARTL